MEDAKRFLRMILNILIPLAGLCIVCFLGPKLLGFFMPFVIGWIIALIANPLVKFLERHLKLVRRHGSMVIIVGVLILVIGLLYLAVVWTYTEMAGFVKDLPLLYDNALSEITEAIENSRKLVTYLPDSLQKPLLEISDNLGGTIGALFSKAAAPTVEIAGNVAKGIPNVMVNTVIMILASYLFLVERDKILRGLKAVLPPFVFRYVDYLKKDARGLIGGYFLAQFRIMFVVAAILAAGLMILGVKYSLVLALVLAVLAALGGRKTVFGRISVCGRSDSDIYHNAGRAADYPAEDCGRFHGAAPADYAVPALYGVQSERNRRYDPGCADWSYIY